MTCKDLGNDRLIEPLNEEQRRHLGSCAACRARQLDLVALADRLEALGKAPAAAADPDLVRRILEAATPRSARKIIVRRASFLPWLAAAAALLFCALLWTLRPAPAPPGPVAVVAPIPEAPPEPRFPEREPIPDLIPPKPAPLPAPVPPPSPLPAPERTPEPPAPSPAAPPLPAPAPAPTRPALPALALASVEGPLESGDGKTWSRAEAVWTADRLLRCLTRPARFVLPDGTSVTLARHSTLRLVASAPPELALEKGLACFEVIPGGNQGFSVATPDARLRVTGTRFSVRVDGHTELIVASGEVVVANEKGSVKVPAGTGMSARKNSAPPAPRPVDADRLTSWSRELDPPERSRLRFDFEDGRLPQAWSSGKVVAGPGRGLNRFCLEGSPNIDANLDRVDRKIPLANAELELRFRYWSADATQITVQLFNDRIQDNFRHDLRRLGHGKWEQIRIPLAAFFRLADGSRIQPGDRFTWFNFSVGGSAGPAYFDDIEFVEILR